MYKFLLLALIQSIMWKKNNQFLNVAFYIYNENWHNKVFVTVWAAKIGICLAILDVNKPLSWPITTIFYVGWPIQCLSGQYINFLRRWPISLVETVVEY